jgi:hypothetical protein
MGLRPAPSEIADPEGHARLQKALNAQAKHKKQAQERREQRRYGGAEKTDARMHPPGRHSAQCCGHA